MKDCTDILIFGGQSNMVGETEGLPNENDAVKNAYEYRYLTNELVELKHPTGEDLFYGQLEKSVKSGGSLIPAFCKKYCIETGKTVVAIQAACGSTTVSEWLHGTRRHYWANKKIQAGIIKTQETFNVERIYYVWLQGESDALIQTSKYEYKNKLIQYKNEIKQEISIDKFGIIKVGYFASVASWIEGNEKEKTKWDEEIMNAQENVVKNDDDFIMLTRICPKLSRDSSNINPSVGGHYNNAALNKIGKVAATTLANFDLTIYKERKR